MMSLITSALQGGEKNRNAHAEKLTEVSDPETDSDLQHDHRDRSLLKVVFMIKTRPQSDLWDRNLPTK